jgi:hypothetical protein
MRSQTIAPLMALTAAMALAILFPAGATAGAITFFDTTDNLFFTDDTGRASGACQGETCIVTLSSPGLPFSSLSYFSTWLEPGSNLISDTFSLVFNTDPFQTITITFTSDDETSLGPCPLCTQTPFEDGTVQTAGMVDWAFPVGMQTLRITDTIKFQSDVEGTPEPSTMILAAIGLVLQLVVPKCGRREFCWQCAQFPASFHSNRRQKLANRRRT